jgi:hypothetical protein
VIFKDAASPPPLVTCGGTNSQQLSGYKLTARKKDSFLQLCKRAKFFESSVNSVKKVARVMNSAENDS